MTDNVRAFLLLIRYCEGTAGENGYRTMFGGGLFDSFEDHPRRAITRDLGGKPLTSSAAGAYQFLSRTWDECAKALSLTDFSPESQDKAAVFLIKRRGALADVEAGRIEVAIRKCNREWASLPGSPYGQPRKTLSECIAVYQQHGGVLADQSQPQVAPMPLPLAPLIGAFLPEIIKAAPELIRVFGKPGSETAERNAKAFEVVGDILKTTTGETTVEGAVGAIKDEPVVAQQFREGVQERWFELVEVGPGIEGAQNYGIKVTQGQPWWNSIVQPAFLVALLLLPLVYYTVYAVLTMAGFTTEIRAMVVASVVSGVLGAITGFFLGSSISSRTKDELIARK